MMKRQNMTIREEQFKRHYFAKNETLMTIGNGYMGIRGSHQEDYLEQTRGHFIAGIYNNAGRNEVSELVNCPNVVGWKIQLGTEKFDLLVGKIKAYERYLDMESGELIRNITWESPNGLSYDLEFRRFCSLDNIHLIGESVTIIAHQQTKIVCTTGIDGQQTNTGVHHFFEEEKRVFEEKYMQASYVTTESEVEVIVSTVVTASNDQSVFFSNRRQLLVEKANILTPLTPYTFEKITLLYTTQDQDFVPKERMIPLLAKEAAIGYLPLFEKSKEKWNAFWGKQAIEIISDNSFDQYAINFALYHLQIMTPTHDTRYSIAAKGLTGEGYKGHVFWDTEIFIFPYYLYTNPKIAKGLLEYRYRNIEAAKEKARQNGYLGTLFPWESAFSGKEETPTWSAMNVKTGKRQKVASAAAEHHIVADISFAVCQYYDATHDDDFMKKQGIEILLENAMFWMSRATLKENGQYVINDVIGPDEYTEHVNNNAYTNHLVLYTMQYLLTVADMFPQTITPEMRENIQTFCIALYIPIQNEAGIIPQDDTFLSKPTIDLTQYKKTAGKQTILLDYARSEINEMQILKQADVVMLLYLLKHKFSKEMIEKNWQYYEKRTIHDSSLSKAIHGIVALYFNNAAIAYEFFESASRIDLGENPESSNEGIHAASLGALWSMVIFGFAGITVSEKRLDIVPMLPKIWESLKFPFSWQGSDLIFHYTKKHFWIESQTKDILDIYVNGKIYNVNTKITL